MDTEQTPTPITPVSTPPQASAPPMPPMKTMSQNFSVKDLQQDVQDVQTMDLIFGGAIIILAVVVTGIVCYLGGIQVPYVSAYFEPAALAPKAIVDSTLPATKNTQASTSTSSMPAMPAATSTTLMATTTSATTK